MTTENSELDIEQIVSQLNELLARNRIASAKPLLDNAISSHPNNIELLTIGLRIDWVEDKLESAKLTIDQILAQEPGHYPARYFLALIHKQEEDFVTTEQIIINLLKDYPQDPDLYATYADVMLATFNYDKAEQLSDEALRLEPEHENALRTKVMSAFINSPGPQTQESLRNLVVEYPDQLGTTVLMIQVLQDQGKTDHAYDLARELVLVQPDNEHIVELASALKVSTHWSMKPLWPMIRYGWGGSIAIWIGIVAITRGEVFEKMGIPALEYPFLIIFILYVVYSWVWPSLLPKLIK